MMPKKGMKDIVSVIFVFLIAGCQVSSKPGKPNIVVILADDMGYSDIGCFGGEIETPNLDRLAEQGLRFTQFYNAGRCCPSRASLLTGQYPHMAGMGWMTGVDMGQPSYSGDLNKESLTIAEALKPAGYAAYAAGKWHVSENVKYDHSKHNWPLQRGFDKYYGIIPGAANYFEPVGLTYGNDSIGATGDFYLTDAISDSASAFIGQHVRAGAESPFFLYVAYNAPHWPLHAKEDDIRKYLEVYRKGWDKIREERYDRQLRMGLIGDSDRLTERDKVIPAWDSISEQEKRVWIKRMAVYAAQIDCMDQGIGRIVKVLKDNSILDNTLVIFISDNGGSAENISRTDKSYEVLGRKESYESYRIHWANASNTPFRWYKSRMHEGGIATPCVISWPETIRNHGSLVRTPAHLIDLMPTFLVIAGGAYPEKYNGVKINPLPGRSLAGLLQGGEFPLRPLFWEHEANRAVRWGKWKLVSIGKNQEPYTSPWELYDVSVDRSETNDLAMKFPEKVKEMDAMWNDWAEANRVYPLNGSNIPTRFKTFGRKEIGYHK